MLHLSLRRDFFRGFSGIIHGKTTADSDRKSTKKCKLRNNPALSAAKWIKSTFFKRNTWAERPWRGMWNEEKNFKKRLFSYFNLRATSHIQVFHCTIFFHFIEPCVVSANARLKNLFETKSCAYFLVHDVEKLMGNSYVLHWNFDRKLFCGIFSRVKWVKKSTNQLFQSKSQYRT